jgi:signal transduction histidine kinase
MSRFPLPRLSDFVWLLLFGALAIFGPDRSEYTIATLAGLCVMQILDSRLEFFTRPRGAIASFVIKLFFWYVLMGWTDGIESSYYWVLSLPVISAATSLGLIGTTITTLLGCGAYLSFLWFARIFGYDLDPNQVPQLALRVIILPVMAYLTHVLAEANRVAVRRYQAAAEQLAEANANLREAQAAALRSQRLAALGQLSAGLAHELRNPLGTMKASAEMLRKNVESSNEIAKEMAGFIASEVDRTNSLITRFLDFARPLAIRPETADLGQVIDRAVEQVERHQPPYDVTIYKNYSPDIEPFPLDPELMERVFYNLVLNAAQASPPQSSITVKTRRLDGTVEVAVIDRGSGIDSKHLENIFNPFFTTKPTGVGLGLAIVSKIVDEHGGKIEVESEPGNGSIFRVFLPIRESA